MAVHNYPALLGAEVKLLQSADGDIVGKNAERLPVVTVDNPKNLPACVTAAEAMSGLPEPRVIPGNTLPRSLPMPYLDNGQHSRYAEFMRQPCVTDVRPGLPSLAM